MIKNNMRLDGFCVPYFYRLVSIILFFSSCYASSLEDLLLEYDDLYRSVSSYTQMDMRIVTKEYKRRLSLEAWSQGDDRSLIRILAPKREAGTSTLKVGRNIWNYLPKINRVIKIPSSMMGASWMGSHMSNDDLLRDNRFSEHFNCLSLTNSPTDRIGFTCTPKASTSVVWGRIELYFSSENRLPIKLLYFDEDDRLARTMTFGDVKTFSGRILPSTITMTVTAKPGESTTVTYRSIEFNPSFKPGFFSLKQLKLARR